MKANMKNVTHIEGYLYQHSLNLKTTGERSKNPGTQFISGDIDIATDNNLVNIVRVHYTYVTAKTSTGKDDPRFNTLQNIINGTICNVAAHGIDKAAKVRIDSAIGVNEFYSNRTGKDELVSAKRNEGGFIHVVQTLAADETTRDTFDCDMIITKVSEIEADEEHNRPRQAKVSGYVFDFRKALIPVDFIARSAGAIDYFVGLEASQKRPVFIHLWGRQLSQTIMVKKVQESAFDGPRVIETPQSIREFVITGADPELYEWDNENTITAQEYMNALADRELAVAAIKQRQDEYNASRAQTQTPSPAAMSGFNF